MRGRKESVNLETVAVAETVAGTGAGTETVAEAGTGTVSSYGTGTGYGYGTGSRYGPCRGMHWL
jgi:hypothetical protein